jgi:hypothetical protein
MGVWARAEMVRRRRPSKVETDVEMGLEMDWETELEMDLEAGLKFLMGDRVALI